MRIDSIHNRMDFITGKIRSAYFSPEQKDEALDIASKQFFRDELKVYGINQDTHESLAPFKVVADFETDAEGVFSINACARLISCEIGIQYEGRNMQRPVKIINDDEKADVRDSQLKPITLLYPAIEILKETSTGFQYQIEPHQEHGGIVRYFQYPPKPKFGYNSVDGDDNPVYNDGLSVQIGWSDKYIDQIIFMAIQVLGIPISSEWMVQNGMMNSGKAAGQAN